MEKLITNWGCQCLSAESSKQALELIKGKDIMLVDYRLREGKNGREAIDNIRQSLKGTYPLLLRHKE